MSRDNGTVAPGPSGAFGLAGRDVGGRGRDGSTDRSPVFPAPHVVEDGAVVERIVGVGPDAVFPRAAGSGFGLTADVVADPAEAWLAFVEGGSVRGTLPP
ncbi:hypothetical protein [Embleya scabrispora]|uniref:hypothetical protein n=1 Tax=Embleya scabrispora TaxID=159449 RepID=UPI001319D696|nr:hypothetical protein [Embleya scabrispora]MYS86575.1 hypothetical protein [Streptomyces sp. SID5474]